MLPIRQWLIVCIRIAEYSSSNLCQYTHNFGQRAQERTYNEEDANNRIQKRLKMEKLMGMREREWKETKKRIAHDNGSRLRILSHLSFAQKETNLLAFQAYDLLYFTHTTISLKKEHLLQVTRISLFLSLNSGTWIWYNWIDN